MTMDLKDKIIQESLKLFSTKGYARTSMSDIGETAKVSRGGIFHHFKSKEDLLLAVLSDARRFWQEKTLTGLDEIDKPVEKVRRLLENFRDRYLKDIEKMPGGCVFVALSVQLDDLPPDLARELTRGFEQLKRMINQLLKQAKESGELRHEVSTEIATETIFSGMLGAAIIYSMEKSSTSLDNSINSLIDYLDGLSR